MVEAHIAVDAVKETKLELAFSRYETYEEKTREVYRPKGLLAYATEAKGCVLFFSPYILHQKDAALRLMLFRKLFKVLCRPGREGDVASRKESNRRWGYRA
jgi:hypothetical protein